MTLLLLPLFLTFHENLKSLENTVWKLSAIFILGPSLVLDEHWARSLEALAQPSLYLWLCVQRHLTRSLPSLCLSFPISKVSEMGISWSDPVRCARFKQVKETLNLSYFFFLLQYPFNIHFCFISFFLKRARAQGEPGGTYPDDGTSATAPEHLYGVTVATWALKWWD